MTKDAAMEVLAANPAVTVMKQPVPDASVDPFWRQVAARAREGEKIRPLYREDSARALIHAAAALPPRASLLTREDFGRLLPACVELNGTDVYFYSSSDISYFLSRTDLSSDKVVLAIDLRDDEQSRVPPHEQNLLLTTLVRFLQSSPTNAPTILLAVEEQT